MFGLAVTASLVITIIAGNSLGGGTGVQGTTHNPYVSDVFTGLGWVSLPFLRVAGGDGWGLHRRIAQS